MKEFISFSSSTSYLLLKDIGGLFICDDRYVTCASLAIVKWTILFLWGKETTYFNFQSFATVFSCSEGNIVIFCDGQIDYDAARSREMPNNIYYYFGQNV